MTRHGPLFRNACLAAVFVLLAACGGGSGGGSSPSSPVAAPVSPPATPTPPSEEPPVSEEPSEDFPAQLQGINNASRLASRATFGSDFATIESIDAKGAEAWIDEQFALPITSHDAVVDTLLAREAAGEFDELAAREDNDNLSAVFGRLAWWHNTITGEDQLRQRVAYALSQIFVISDEVNALLLSPYGTSNYYDMLLANAFGNVRALLEDVTLHPAMGIYLSHLNNARSDPESGTFPDENYAREAMQLFSIGLFELNPDGSEVVDEQGQPVPTYDNDDIREFAKIYTGLSWGGNNNRFGSDRYNFSEPMRMFDAFHEPGEKRLLNGVTVPAGQEGIVDIQAAMDNLFMHPNISPFLGKQLIQRLVTSNPSPAYVARVSAAFEDNGVGERGDMRAILKAILLDPEALAEPDPQSGFGKLREPLLRYTAMLRQLGVASPDGFYANFGFFVQQLIQQHPLSAPSVFNFYSPNHQPIGELAAEGLVSPEFQITNSNSIIEISNLMRYAVVADLVNDFSEPPFSKASLTLDGFLPLADDVEALLTRLDTVFTYGTLSDDTRSAIRDLVTLLDDPELRVRVAAYLLLISPDYAVEM
ncbi:DUF1800 domain-containing protein [Congregibacter litoralis]|uniref:DUF1800 domain-containing protein n=1 Tax=Congregibacter litoralis KT71 TaxID=314285 RepID=A4AA67_9GAMM|nr:DUF1800 domain-containing protein [Congregibacter litoralis]EAQ96944.1 hypothetical protein KT71_11815 [Congregibacter litoralis KT71]